MGDLWFMEEDRRVPVGVSRRWREVVARCFRDGEVGGDGMKKVGGGRRDGEAAEHGTVDLCMEMSLLTVV